MNEHIGFGGNGGTVTEGLEETMAKAMHESLKEAGIDTPVTITLGEKPSSKRFDPHSPKQAREAVDEELARQANIRISAQTLQDAGKEDIRKAQRVLNPDQGTQDFLREVYPEETAHLEGSARRSGKSETMGMVVGVGTAVVYAAVAIGSIYAAHRKSKTLKGRLLNWLAK